MSDFSEEIINDFIAECSDLIEAIEPEMLSSNNLNKELANNMFRPIHSLKGSSASLGFNHMAKAVHGAEELLSLFRSGEYESNDEGYLQFFLVFFDFIRKGFECIASKKSDADIESDSLKIQTQAKSLKDKLLIKTKDGEDKAQTQVPNKIEEAPIPAKRIEDIDDLLPLLEKEKNESKQEEAIPEVEVKVQSENTVSAPDTANQAENEASFVDEDMLHAFIAEATEGMNALEIHFLNLSLNPKDKSILKECFRIVHSFKGNCGIFSFKDLETVGHRMESLFDSIINERVSPHPAMFNTFLTIIDDIRNKISSLSSGSKANLEKRDIYLKLLDEYAQGKSTGAEETKNISDNKEEETPKNDIVEKKPPQENPKEEQKSDSSKKDLKNQRQDIRVDLQKLDLLNNLVGELVTVKTMIFEHFKDLKDHEKTEKTYSFLNRITTELQDVSMNIRMIPISGLFKRMIRIVHDISSKSGKKVNFKFFGEETEIDKTVIEKITDPLVHMIRNAVDHGVESPENRLSVGKAQEGSLTLSAKNEAGEIWISIQDDGKGLDKEAIIKKGISQGLIQDPKKLSDNEIYNLIFLPGFSTAKQVTDISGRGVGMDVVKQNIQSIKGKVDIHTEVGKGTTFIIKIPLTLAIIQGMMVETGKAKYTIPIETIIESVKVTKDQLSKPMGSHELVKIRDNLLPVVRLSHIHHLQNSLENIEDGILVIAEYRGKRIALMVDELLGQQETVVKPLPRFFKNVKGISGCSILGNGDATLILDIGSLIEMVDKSQYQSHGSASNSDEASSEIKKENDLKVSKQAA